MTKDKIKKALECCDSHMPSACGDCPYCWVEECKDKLIADALTLITEQEKEIKKQNGRVKCLKTRLANKIVLLSNVEDLYESETQKLKEEKQELKTALKQAEDNYSRAFERLKAQEREIEQLKDGYARVQEQLRVQEQFAKYQIVSDKEIKARRKQAQIDVLNELKTRHDYAIEYMGYPWDISQQIDELIAEVENDD